MFIMVSAWLRSQSRSSAGIARTSQIVTSGSGAATCSTKSAGEPWAAIRPSSSSTTSWVRSRIRATCLGVKLLATRPRSRVLSGGSMRLIDSACTMGSGVIRGKSRPVTALRLNRRSVVTVRTSSYRVTSQASPSP